MNRLVSATLGAILSLGLLLASPRQTAADQAALQGDWTAIKAERDGKSADDVVGHRLIVSGGDFRIQSENGAPIFAGTFRVDLSAIPARIDFEHTEGPLKGKVWKGIFALDGETLNVCDNAPNPAMDRPTAFAAENGSGYVLVTFVRAAPKP